MKTLAYMETRKLSRFLAAQQQVVDSIAAVAADFLGHFHSLVARSVNALRGRRDHFWEARQTSVVTVDRDDELWSRKIGDLGINITDPVLRGIASLEQRVPPVQEFPALSGKF